MDKKILNEMNMNEKIWDEKVTVGLSLFRKRFGGLGWVFVNGVHKLSIICHEGSYGFEHGTFEIMPSWKSPDKFDAVEGHLDFGDVQKWINQLMKLDPKKRTEYEERGSDLHIR